MIKNTCIQTRTILCKEIDLNYQNKGTSTFIFCFRYSKMATVVHKNGMNSLSNGAVNHLVMDQYMMKEPVQQQKLPDDQIQLQAQNEVMQQCDKNKEEPEPEIDIVINNVVCSFSVRCHLNLRQIALNGVNVEFRREHGVSLLDLTIL